MDIDEEFSDLEIEDNAPNKVRVYPVVGVPLMTCSPFVTSLNSAFYHTFCKHCLEKLDKTCDLYCSLSCEDSDKVLHRIDRIVIDSFESLWEISEHYHYAVTSEDFLELNKLFFRVLYTSKFNSISATKSKVTRFEKSFFPTIESYDDIVVKLRISSSEPERVCREKIEAYLEEFDELMEHERLLRDKELGISIPDNEFFVKFIDEILISEVEETIENLLDSVEENLNPKRDFLDQFSFDENEGIGFSSRPLILSGFGKEQLYRVISHGLSSKSSPDKIFEAFQNYQRQNLAEFGESEELEHLPEHSPTELLKFYKRQFRAEIFDFLLFQSDQTQSNRTAEDRQYGRWIRALNNFISNTELKQLLDGVAWEEIVKAFFVTLRYAIAIPDFVGSHNIGYGIYLPMVRVEHACSANTSTVFNGRTLELFYLPPAQIQLQLNSRRLKSEFDSSRNVLKCSSKNHSLPKNLPVLDKNVQIDVTFNYHFNKMFDLDFKTLRALDKLCFLQCRCEKCKNVKSHRDEASKYQQFQTGLAFGEMDVNMDDTSDDEIVDEDVEFYEKCVDQIHFFASLYGNMSDDEFARKIQKTLDDIVDQMREILGFYHPRISGILFFALRSKFQLIFQEKDDVVLFYMYRFVHSVLLEAIESTSVTHGKDHYVVKELEHVHHICHNNLGKFYLKVHNRLEQLEPDITGSLSLEIFTVPQCHQLVNIPFEVAEIDWQHKQLYNRSESPVIIAENDDLSFDPVTRQQVFDLSAHGMKRTISESEQTDISPQSEHLTPANPDNNMTDLLRRMENILNFSQHRYL